MTGAWCCLDAGVCFNPNELPITVNTLIKVEASAEPP